MTEAAKFLTENTAKFSGGSYLTARYTDIIHPKPEEARTAEQITDHVRGKLQKIRAHGVRGPESS